MMTCIIGHIFTEKYRKHQLMHVFIYVAPLSTALILHHMENIHLLISRNGQVCCAKISANFTTKQFQISPFP
jgi:hypothetical protein